MDDKNMEIIKKLAVRIGELEYEKAALLVELENLRIEINDSVGNV